MWTSPRTWVTGEVVTAALLNTHLRDNLLETAAAKVTTAGDLAYATGANALARLAAGTSAQVLHGGTTPSWSAVTMAQLETQPYCHVTKSSSQSLSNSTETVVAFGSESYDGPEWHDNATNNSRITPTTAGRYLVILNIGWGVNSTGERFVFIYKNDPTDTANRIAVGSTKAGANGDQVNVSTIVYLNGTTDYIASTGLQNCGTNLTIEASYVTYLIVAKLAGTG